LSALYPQLLPEDAIQPIALDQPPTYTDLVNEYFPPGENEWLTALDALIAQLDAAEVAFLLDLPNLDIDLGTLTGIIPDPANPFDTSGADTLEENYPLAYADLVGVACNYDQVLIGAGMQPTGLCPSTTATPPGGGSSPTPPGGGGSPGAGPYPANPNPPPNGAAGCTDLGGPINLSLNIPDLTLGGEPYTFVLNSSQWGGVGAALYANGNVGSGPSDMVFITPGLTDPASGGYFVSYFVTVYPARAGSFNAGLWWYTAQNASTFWNLCLSFNVDETGGYGGIPDATPQTIQELQATVPGAYFGVAPVQLAAANLGDPPVVGIALNSQWGYPTSGVYGPGKIVGGPADMLTLYNYGPDPASPGATVSIGYIMTPIRAGSWVWMVEYFEDAAQTIPVYLFFQATVTAPASS